MGDTLSNRDDWRIARRALIIMGMIALAITLWLLRDIALLVIASIILAIFLNIFIYSMVNLGMSRQLAVPLVLVIAAILALLIAIIVIPVISDQLNTLLTKAIPDSIDSLSKWWTQSGIRYRFPIIQEFDAATVSQNIVNQFSTALGGVTSAIFPIIGGFVNVLLGLATIIFLVIFFVIEPEKYVQGFVQLFPPALHRPFERHSRHGQYNVE